MTNQQQIEDEFFGHNWVSPKLAVPATGEIIAIAVELEGGARIIQTAVYEKRPDGAEAWLCGQPFAVLLYWHSLKNFDALAIPPEEANPFHGEIVILHCTTQQGEDVFQSAIFFIHEDGKTEWICGHVYEKLNRWYSLPMVPEQEIMLPRFGLIH